MLIRIPFHGFYYSVHSQLTEYEINSMLNENSDLINRFQFDSYRDYMRDYAKYFVKLFSNKTGIELSFNSISSPREYNFETDKIYCNISPKQVITLYHRTSKLILAKKAKDLFQSRDGFISFYPYHIDEWPNSVLQWDCNHLYCLLLAYLEQHDLEFDESELMIDEINHSSDWLYTIIDSNSNLSRLSNIAYYLDKRANR